MIEKLFSSKTRVDILKLFLFNPEGSYYQRHISALIHQPIRGVQREVAKLESIGLIEKSVQGNRVYYKANRKCPIFEDLKRILLKTVGIGQVLRDSLVKRGNIDVAFIYGSCARGQEDFLSDIDLLAVGSISLKELSTALSRPRSELGREINYAVFTRREIRQRARNGDHFLNEVLRSEKVFIVGSEDELRAIIRAR